MACTGGTIPFESTAPSEVATTTTTTTTTLPNSPVATDLVMWLDANAASTITTVSGAVSSWSDKTTNGNNALQSTASARPTINVGGLNSKNTMNFDGTDDFFVVADSASTKPINLHIFVVAKARTYTMYAPLINKTTDYGTWSDGYGLNLSETDPNSVAFWVNSYIDNTAVEKNFATVSFNAFHIFSGSYNSTNSTLYIDGTSVASIPELGTLTQSNRAMTIGMNYSGTTMTTTITPLDGEIAEILIYQSSLSNSNRQLVEGYLAQKWGLQSILPNGHPYKP